MKKTGKVTKSTVAMPVLPGKGFLDTENEQFYNDTRCVSWSTKRSRQLPVVQPAQLPKQGTVIQGATSGDLFKTARQVLFKGGIDTLLVEFCASTIQRSFNKCPTVALQSV